MAQSTDTGVPFGEGVIQWWETGRGDPEEAQDWFTEEIHALAQRLEARFPGIVARTSSET